MDSNNLFNPDTVQDILTEHENTTYLNPNIFGLNISRSQSAAPIFSSSVSPPRGRFPSHSGRSESFGETQSSKNKAFMDDNNGIDMLFGGPVTSPNPSRRHFFHNSDDDEDHNDGGDEFHVMSGFIKRPASTGGIDRNYNSESDRDVNSILETLGLTSLESEDNIVASSNGGNNGGAGTPNKKYFEENSMIRHEGEHVSSSSKASKYFTRDTSQDEEEVPMGASQNQFGGYDYGGKNNGTSNFRTGGQTMQQQQPQQQQQQQHSLYSQFAQQQQQHPSAGQYDSHQPQFPNPFHDSQQQMFYNQQPSQYVHQQPQPHLPNVMPSSQPALYQLNSPTSQNIHHQPFAYDYQQQQEQQNQQQPHISLQQGTTPMIYSPPQPQFISIVPIQTAHPPLMNGHSPAYAYVQYGPDGSMQLHHPQQTATPTFIMGPHGQPIALATVPMNSMYGTSPPDGMSHNLASPRTPSRSGLKPEGRGPRTPGTPNGKMRNCLSSPRGGKNRGEKNIVVPSRMGPVAVSLLNEIRAAKSRNQWTVHDIGGHVIEFCLDQNGSRFIQQRLEVADAIEKKAVMDEVVPSIKELQNDVFGNYVIQKLFEFGNDDIKRDLKETLKGNMMLLSLQMYGCRVIQKALESLDYDDLVDLLREFRQNVLICIQDQNGNHVMQKCIEVISIKAKEAEFQSGQAGVAQTMAKSIQFVINDVLANVESLCCHPYGCRVLQRMLEHCVDVQKIATLDEIQLCHKTLMDDQYGNYVIQHVLQYGRDSDRDSLLKIILENDLLKLSRQKFASNVVEKLLKYGNSYQRNGIVREMLKVVSDDTLNQEGAGSTVLLLMVRDAYANYVVQTAIDVVPEGTEKRMLIDELKANEAHLRNYTFAKHIVAKLGTK